MDARQMIWTTLSPWNKLNTGINVPQQYMNNPETFFRFQYQT